MEKEIYNYALDADEETLKQFENCYSQNFVTAAALMPDAHKGYAAPIGAVLITKKFVVPAWVGYDIGCGLIAVHFSPQEKNIDIVKEAKAKAQQIYSAVSKKVPMGVGEINKKSSSLSISSSLQFKKILEEFQQDPYNKDVLNYLKTTAPKHLGTLGGGNHFIELSTDEAQKELWLVIHSGSRGIGHKVATRYMIKASGSKTDYEKTFPLDTSSQIGKEYLNILDFGLKYALLNRLEMAHRVHKALETILKTSLKSELWTNKTHNHALAEKGEYIHRKGATPAKKGERGVIPANMRDGSFLVEGLGSAKFLHSSSHGAGRTLSRTQAKKQITLQHFKEEMQGITGTISQKTLDEAPDAYKDIFKVMEAQKASVKSIKHLLPIINWKG